MNATTAISADSRAQRACLWRLQLGSRLALFDSTGQDVTPKGRKARAIVTCLALQPGQPIRRERLIELLWGDRFESQARLSLRQCLFEIRKSAGELLIHSDRENLWVEPSTIQVDEKGEDPFAAVSGITPELDDWLSVEKERRAGDNFAQLKDEAQALLGAERTAEALRLIDRMRRLDPYHECWLRLAMKADQQAGNPSAIEKRFTEFSQMLERELGVGPSNETRALRDRLIGELTKAETVADEVRPPADDAPSGRSPANAQKVNAVWQSGRLRRPTLAGTRRLAILAAAIALVAAFAIWQRNSVLEQRRQAESMAEFMLGNFKDKIAPTGKLDAIEGVAQRVVDYYKERSNGDLSEPELRQRSRALSLLGQVQDLRGNTDAAVHFYLLAAAGTAEEVRRNPNDPQRLFDHAQNIFWIGDIQRTRGDVDTAESYYREYKRLAERMSTLDPDNLKWRMEVVYANEDVGIALLDKRQFAEAVEEFQSALGPMQSAVTLDQSKSSYQWEFANVLGWLADAERASGDLKTAATVRERQIRVLEQSISNGSDDVDLREKLATAHEGLGVLFTELGNTTDAMDQYQLGLHEADRLMAVEPKNTSWADLDADIRLELASSLIDLGRRDRAAPEAVAGCRLANELIARDQSIIRWQTLRTMCLTEQARLALASGAPAEASPLAEQAMASARSERSGDRVADRYHVAAAATLLGDIRRATGDLAGAAAVWGSALDQLPSNVNERPWEMKVRADLLSRLARTSDEATIESRLNAMGYRRAVT